MTNKIDFEEIKLAAQGRWNEILSAKIQPAQWKVKKSGPCPMCEAGMDRYHSRPSFDEDGAVHCRRCWTGGDGFALLKDRLGIRISEVFQLVGEFLGVITVNGQPATKPKRQKKKTPSPEVDPETEDEIELAGRNYPKGATLNGKPVKRIPADIKKPKQGDVYEWQDEPRQINGEWQPVKKRCWLYHRGKWRYCPSPTFTEAVKRHWDQSRWLPAWRDPDYFTPLADPKTGKAVGVTLRWNLSSDEQIFDAKKRRDKPRTKIIHQFTLTFHGWLCSHGVPVKLYNQTRCTHVDDIELTYSKLPKHYHGLDEHPDEDVWILEGEKCFTELLDVGGFLVVSWAGGVDQVKNVVLSPLKGRRLRYLGDNDEKGRKARGVLFDRIRKECPTSELLIHDLKDIDPRVWRPQEGDDVADLIRRVKGRLSIEPCHRIEEMEELAKDAEIHRLLDSLPDITSRLPMSLKNHTEFVSKDEDGKERVDIEPMSIDDIDRRLTTRTGGWPYVVGGELFIDNGEGEIQYLQKPAKLFSWLGKSLGLPPAFINTSGMHTKEEFFEYCRAEHQSFNLVELYPHFPPRSDSYYSHREVVNGDGSHLERFLDFFRAVGVDRLLLKTMMMTMVSGTRDGQRPAFLITATDRNVGKTKLATLLAEVFGGFINCKPKEDFDLFTARLLSVEGRKKRIVVIDNIKSPKYSNPELEALITLPMVSGRANNVGEQSRPNNITWILSFNDPQLSEDLATRGVEIRLLPPNRSDNWLDEVMTFIDQHRWDIIGDLKTLIEGEVIPSEGNTRFASWDRDVLKKLPDAEHAIKTINERQREASADRGEAEGIEEYFAEQLADYGYAEAETVFIPYSVAEKWYREATRNFKATVNQIGRTINRYFEAGTIKRLQRSKLTNPRGLGWNHAEAYQHTDLPERIKQREFN